MATHHDPHAGDPIATGPGPLDGPLVRTATLRALLGVGRTRFYELIWEPGFPRPVRLGAADSELVWFTREILDWLSDLPRVAPPAERRAVAAADVPHPGSAGAVGDDLLRPAGPRRVPTGPDDGIAAEPVGPDEVVLVPAPSGRRAS